MKTVNDVVQERLGRMVINLCEAEVFLADREARIAELEQENERLTDLLAQFSTDHADGEVTADGGHVD